MSKYRKIILIKNLFYLLSITGLLFQGLYVTVPEALATDTTPPTLSSLTFSKSAVNTTLANDQLIVTATFTDDTLSGTEGYFGISFQSPSGNFSFGSTFNEDSCKHVTYLAGSASCTTHVPFKQFIESGTWTASVLITDPSGNSKQMSYSDLSTAGFPYSINVTSGTPDTTPPTLTSLTFSKSSVNTTASPDSITVTATFADNPNLLVDTGGYFSINFFSPSGERYIGNTFQNDPCDFVTYTNGLATCTTTITFDQHIEAGTWSAVAFPCDVLRNCVYMYSSDLSAAGFPSSVNVTSN